MSFKGKMFAKKSVGKKTGGKKQTFLVNQASSVADCRNRADRLMDAIPNKKAVEDVKIILGSLVTRTTPKLLKQPNFLFRDHWLNEFYYPKDRKEKYEKIFDKLRDGSILTDNANRERYYEKLAELFSLRLKADQDATIHVLRSDDSVERDVGDDVVSLNNYCRLYAPKS